MRNIDWIRDMSASELAFFLLEIHGEQAEACPNIGLQVIDGVQMYDDKDVLFWLLQEREPQGA